jgi:4-amino-4-deoxy-L-arabinose transferase-like glycosyltransferase
MVSSGINEERNALRPQVVWQVVGLMLLAFILRTWSIDEQSLRGDEALSVIYAQKPWLEIVEITRTVSGHPPLFYLGLHLWEKVAGISEFATRFFAAWWGTLVVALVFVLANALFGAKAAQWATLLMAINPFHIWHAQDVRPYSMLTAFALLACLIFWRALSWPGARGPRSGLRGWWLLYALSGLLVVYVHYFGAFLILAHAIWFAWDRLRRRGPWWGGIIGFSLIGLLLLPWLWYARAVITGDHGPGGQTLSLWASLQQCFVTFGVGYWSEAWGTGVLAACLALLLGWGLWTAVGRSPREAGFVVLNAAIPFLSVFVLSRTRPIFRERYLIASAPMYTLLWGVGLSAFGRFRRARGTWFSRALLVASVLLLIGTSGFALTRYYVDDRYAKSPDWRGVASFIRAQWGANDVVILNHQDQAFLYHFGTEDLQVLPLEGAKDQGSVRASVQDLSSQYDRIWLLPDTARLWDEQGLVRDALDQECELVMSRTWRGVLLLLYHTPEKFERERTALDVWFEGEIQLLGYVLRDSDGNAVDRMEVAPGQEVRITLYWRTQSRIDKDYVVFVHVLDRDGWLRGQQDNQPRQGTFPTRAWAAGAEVVDAYDVAIAPESPVGQAYVEVGLYDPRDAKRVQVSGQDGDPAQDRVLLSDVLQIR